MKNILLSLSLSLLAAFTVSVYADDMSSTTMAPAATSTTTTTTNVSGQPMMNGQHPCHAIEEACKAAGYTMGGAATGKGMMSNCMKPLMSGQAVSGVNVSASDLSACQAKRSARQAQSQVQTH